MIEFIIAYDERDEKLGSYFQKCRDGLTSTIQNMSNFPHSANEVPSNRCNRAYLDIALARLKEIPFIIAAYMHGNPKQLIANGGRFVDADEDNAFFKYALFYTNSCSCGKQLGPSLIVQQCRVFIGYDQEVEALRGDYEDTSVSCDNYGIYALLSQDITVFDAYKQMKANYTREIERLKKLHQPLCAAVLITSREALVFHGDKELKKVDLFAISNNEDN